MLYAWKEQADKLSSEEISREEYDNWRYHYPKFDTTQRWQKYPHRNLVTLWLKCSKTNSNQINKDDKKPLAMSFIPTAKGLVYNMDLFVAQPPVNHSLTAKPLDYKNNGFLRNCYQFVIKRLLEVPQPRINTGFLRFHDFAGYQLGYQTYVRLIKYRRKF